jgi:hypothetical protein
MGDSPNLVTLGASFLCKSYNASVVKNYSAPNSMARFYNKNSFSLM